MEPNRKNQGLPENMLKNLVDKLGFIGKDFTEPGWKKLRFTGKYVKEPGRKTRVYRKIC